MRYFLYPALVFGTPLFGFIAGTAPVLAACPYQPVSDCFDDAKSKAKEILTDPLNFPDNSRRAGEAVVKCIECAAEELSNKLRTFTPNSSSNSSVRAVR